MSSTSECPAVNCLHLTEQDFPTTSATTTLESLSSSPSAPEPARASAPPFYRPELDVLRFLAFLAVFICHILPAQPLTGSTAHSSGFWRVIFAVKDAGNFGVCIFFILSSFLITELLRRERQKTGTVHVRAFFVRRMLRIWPLYFTVLLLFVIAGIFDPAFRIEPQRLLAYSLLVGNWYIYFHPLITGPLRSLWSISVEEQFYALWPTIAKWSVLRGVALLSVLLLPISMLTTYWVAERGQFLYNTLWLNSFVQFQFFGIGALLAIYFAGRVPQLNWLTRAILVSAGLGLWLAASGICLIKRQGYNPSPSMAMLGYCLAAIGGIFLFLAMFGVPSRYMPKPLIYLGKISYGLYVFHEVGLMATEWVRLHLESYLRFESGPLRFLFNASLALGLTICLAALSYKYLEQPFLKLKERFTFVPSRAA